MPCYTKVQTNLIDTPTIEAAAAKLGINVRKINENTLVLSRNGSTVTLSRANNEMKFDAENGTGDYRSLLADLTPTYAQKMLVKFAKSKGYTVVAGAQPGEYQLVKYE